MTELHAAIYSIVESFGNLKTADGTPLNLALYKKFAHFVALHGGQSTPDQLIKEFFEGVPAQRAREIVQNDRTNK